MLAMQDEMKRSMSELRMKDAPAPYYIAYEVQDRTVTDVSGRLGALIENLPRRMRVLRVEVRVGDYAFDSSRFISQGFGGGAVIDAIEAGDRALIVAADLEQAALDSPDKQLGMAGEALGAVGKQFEPHLALDAMGAGDGGERNPPYVRRRRGHDYSAFSASSLAGVSSAASSTATGESSLGGAVSSEPSASS